SALPERGAPAGAGSGVRCATEVWYRRAAAALRRPLAGAEHGGGLRAAARARRALLGGALSNAAEDRARGDAARALELAHRSQCCAHAGRAARAARWECGSAEEAPAQAGLRRAY